MNFLCWIHFCRMPSCKWHCFPTNRKIQNGRHQTSSIRIFVIFIYNFLVCNPWYIEIYLGCIALVIWDTKLLMELGMKSRDHGFEPYQGCAIFHLIQYRLLQWHLYRQIYIYIHICIYIFIYTYIFVCVMHCFDDLIHDDYQWNIKLSKNCK